jgi:hypothetical protein
MESHPALVVWSELLLPPLGVAILCILMAQRLTPFGRRFRWWLVSVISAAQLLLFMAVFSVSFGFGDAGGHVPWPLGAATLILAFPLVYLLYFIPLLGLARSFVADGVMLLGIVASLNAVLWGLTLDRLMNRLRRTNAV